MESIAIVIVTYRPTQEILKNFIKTKDLAQKYGISKFFCVDNSPEKSEISNFFAELSDIEYIFNNNYGGLSRALNIGCKMAISNDAEYAVLMDQDTIFPESFFTGIREYLINLKNGVGILAPNMYRLIRSNSGDLVLDERPLYGTETSEVEMVVTSGSIIDLRLYSKVGGFDEKLFIGHIDRDYSCKVINAKRTILRLGNVFVYQENGYANESNKISIGNRTFYSSNYSSERYYYAIRNELYLRRLWGSKYTKEQRSPILKNIILLLLLEDCKLGKLRAMIRGAYDSRRL